MTQPTNPLADEIRRIPDHYDADQSAGDRYVADLVDRIERLADVPDLGLTADQEIRARALAIAVDAIARVPGWSQYEPLRTAGQLAEWIRSGWPRDDGNDGPRPEPATADTEPTTAPEPEQGGALPVDPSTIPPGAFERAAIMTMIELTRESGSIINGRQVHEHLRELLANRDHCAELAERLGFERDEARAEIEQVRATQRGDDRG